MKNIYYILTFFLFANVLLGSEIEFTNEEKEYLKDKKVVKMCGDPNWMPFEKIQDGKHIGFTADYMQLLSKKIDTPMTIVPVLSWEESVKKAKNRECDIYSLASKTPDRQKYMNFTIPYIETPLAIIVKHADKLITSLDNIQDKKFAIIKGYAWIELYKAKYPNIKIIEVDSIDDGLFRVEKGEVFGYIDNSVVAKDYLQKNYMGMLEVGGKLNETIKFSVGTRNDEPKLLGIFNKAIKSVDPRTHEKLLDIWLSGPTNSLNEQKSSIKLTGKEKEYIRDYSITYTGDPNWLPFEAFDENGNYTGIIAEHIMIIERRLNKKFDKIITDNWLDTLELSKKRGVDIISGDAADVVLSKNYKAIDTYLKNPLIIVTRKEHPYVDDLNNIKDKKIALGAGGGYSADILKKYPDIKFVECNTPQSGLLGVKTGQYDAFIGTLSMSEYSIVQMGIEDIKIAGQTGIVMNLTLFVDREKPLLYSIINKSIKTISKEKQHEIISKWRSPKVKNVIDYTLVWQISMVFFILALIGLFFTFMLRQSNKRLKQSEQETRYLSERMVLAFDGSRDGLWDWNLIDDTLYFSPRWKEMLGYRDDELENCFETWESRVHPDDLATVTKDIELSINDADVVFENKHRLRHKDGHWVWIYDRGKVQHNLDGKAIRMIGTHTDLTTEINLSDELSKMNETLEKRVENEVEKNREQQLIMMQQSRHAQMGEMISMIAHQWRQPLNNLSMIVQSVTLKHQDKKLSNELMQRLSHDAKKQIEQMSQTIDDFRGFFKPDKKAERFSVNASITHVINLLNPILRQNEIVLKTDLQENIEIVGFSNELGQSLINIVNNAKDALLQKSSNDKKVINIILRKEDAKVLISIVDNGGGIDLDIIQKIFEPYFSTKQDKNGTGLGLYMSKTIIEEHMEGTLTAANTDSGAEFLITLPLNNEEKL